MGRDGSSSFAYLGTDTTVTPDKRGVFSRPPRTGRLEGVRIRIIM